MLLFLIGLPSAAQLQFAPEFTGKNMQKIKKSDSYLKAINTY